MLKAIGVSLALATAGAAAAWLPPETPTPAAAPSAQSLYTVQCAGCHGGKMEGGQFGPALKGAPFAHWQGKRAELLKYVSASMPPNAGGILSASEYAAVVDLMLKTNGQTQPGAPGPVARSLSDAPAANAPMGAIGPQRTDPESFHGPLYAQGMAAQRALLSSLRPVTAEMLRSPPDGAWLSWRRTQDASGYSPLKQIDKSSVSGLHLKWAWNIANGKNEIAPLVHDGVMFINSAYVVEAIDAVTGTLLWRYTRDIPPEHRGALKMIQRSMAMYDRMLFVPTADRHLIALDMATGKLVWDTEIVPASMPDALVSSGPVIAGDILVQGAALGAMCAGGCYALGIDPRTGKVLWHFDNVARSGKPGGDSWNGTPDKQRTGGAIWVTPSYDPEQDAVYYGTSGTYDISRLLKPNPAAKGENSDALYTDSTIALGARTGKLLWHHQHFPREVWDLDEAFERSLIDVPVDGRPRKLVVSIGKLGVLDALDRTNGRYAFSIDLGLNNLVTAIDPKTGRRTIDPAKVPTPNQPVEVCPSVEGVRNWMATAYDPVSHVLYLPLQELCMSLKWIDGDASEDPVLDMSWTMKPWPNSDGRFGRVQAIDMVTRKPLWTNRTRAVPSSSLLVTAGGLLFSGSSDRWFRALDDRTGKTLWETRLNASPSSTPLTFTVGGKQYVAIVTGGGGYHEAQSMELTPEFTPSAPATTIWVFGL